MSALLTYALNESGELVFIDDVKKGNACKCICPHCKNPLDAKNGGKIRDHHFAHSHGNVCESAYETTLHLLAKNIILEEKAIMLPTNVEGFPGGFIRFISVEQEKTISQYESDIRPDLVAVTENGESIFIELFVSHKNSNKKREIIIQNNLKCIEVDLNYVELNKNEIRSFLIRESNNRNWVVPIEEKKKGNGDSFSLPRNPLHQNAIDKLKYLFDNHLLKVNIDNEDYELSKLGYDVCEPGSRVFRGFKSDLLLYRSQKEDKGYIAISIRGRRRNFGFKKPANLRIIDVIIKEQWEFDRFENTEVLFDDYSHVIFAGFKDKSGNIIHSSYDLAYF